MATAVAHGWFTTYINWGGVPWTDLTTANLPTSTGTYGRAQYLTTQFDAIHDGCVIDGLRIEFTASASGVYPTRYAKAEFAGLFLDVIPANSSTLYELAKDAVECAALGITPALLRGDNGEVGVISSCRNENTFYSTSISMSLVTVTVWYTDNGMPQMLQFTL